MFKLSPLRRCAVCVIAAYLLTALELPTTSYADEKSTKSKTEVNRWHPRHRETDDSYDAQLKVALVILGIVVVAAIIKQIAKHHGDDEERENEIQKTSETQACLGDSLRVLFVQPTLRKNAEQTVLPCLREWTPLVKNETNQAY